MYFLYCEKKHDLIVIIIINKDLLRKVSEVTVFRAILSPLITFPPMIYEIPNLQKRTVLAANAGQSSNSPFRVVGTGVPPCRCGNFSISVVTRVVWTEYSRRFRSVLYVLMTVKLGVIGLCCSQQVLMEHGKRWPCKLSWTCISISSTPNDYTLNHLVH